MTVIVCPCGCGERFSPTDSRGRPRAYFSPGCSLRVNNYMRLGKDNPFKGRRHTDETRAVLAAKATVPKPYLRGSRNGMSGRTGASNPNYKDGSSPERQRLYASGEWKELARQAYARDGYRCRKCNAGRPLHAHHVKPWAQYPELRFDLDNLLTLCRNCHHDEHRKEVRHQ